jgi:hypothetical protein
MHARKIHDEISMFLFPPDGLAFLPFLRGVERTGYGCSGFLCPDAGDSLWNSLVFSHAHSAQILEFRWLAAPNASQRGLERGRESRKGFFHLPAIVHEPLEKGRNIARFNLAAMKKFSRNSHRSAPD